MKALLNQYALVGKKLFSLEEILEDINPNEKEFFCPDHECGEQLILRRGTRMRAHLAHKAFSACSGGSRESILHQRGKEAVAEFFRSVGYSVHVERSLFGGSVIPDLIVEGTGTKMAIEIVVTHKMEFSSFLQYKKQSLPVFSIDFSQNSLGVEETIQEWLRSPSLQLPMVNSNQDEETGVLDPLSLLACPSCERTTGETAWRYSDNSGEVFIFPKKVKNSSFKAFRAFGSISVLSSRKEESDLSVRDVLSLVREVTVCRSCKVVVLKEPVFRRILLEALENLRRSIPIMRCTDLSTK
jgi:predicted RNA-binding Zn-ribbon protein involved in translation (DUF1610 family)